MKFDSGKLRSSRGLHFWWSLNGFVAAAYFGMLPQMLYAQESSSVISLRDATAGSGFDFRYENGSVGKVYLVEVVGSGLCLFDADNDGYIDIYMLNGAALPGKQFEVAPSDRFFRNTGNLKFVESTLSAGLIEEGYGMGVTAADFDSDGFEDLYINNFGANALLRNNGDGTFVNVTQLAGVADGQKFGAGVTFLDINADGHLDLFVGNYVDFDFERHDELAPRAIPYAPATKDYQPLADSLFLNKGDGTFEDVSRMSLKSVAGPSMGLVAADFDRDGDVDILVGCDGAPNLYYLNDGQGVFSESALLAGVALDYTGSANGSMGVDAADVDGNGFLDIAITNYADQQIELFRNVAPGGFFDEISSVLQIGRDAKPHVNWGLGLIDLDLDSDVDAFICNGHLLKNAKEIEPRTDYAVANIVMENQRGRLFRNVSQTVGSALQQVACSRSAGFDDLDNDGDIDIVVLNCDSPSQLIANESSGGNHWLQLQLCGRSSNRSAIGAKVSVYCSDQQQYFEQLNGRGYQSHFGGQIYVGLGAMDKVDRIEIAWPNSREPMVLSDVVVDQRLVVVEP